LRMRCCAPFVAIFSFLSRSYSICEAQPGHVPERR
jgi:hypothetical protein